VSASTETPSPLPLLAPEPEPSAPTTPIEKVKAPVTTQSKVYIQFLADQSFMSKYRVAAALLSNRLPRLTFEGVFAALIDDFVHRHDPAERHERREKAAGRAEQTMARPPLPVRMRDAVFARDLGRCTFVGSDGQRCNETIRLEVDHIKPVARGGTNDITNLRLLCAKHNRLQAERILGRQAMDRFRKES
jgi:5-methylcytosine-specific restriction endonuclease McrA